MERSLAEENYLKAVFHLSIDTDESVSTGSLADFLEVSSASVTDKMKQLKRKGLVNYQKSKGVVLSELGRKVALSVIRKHRLWEQFLVEVLEFDWDEIHDMAEQLEHIHSDKLIERIDQYLGFPKFDPHGDPIPDPLGNIAKPELLSLDEAPEDKQYKIEAVNSRNPEFLRFLDKKKLSIHSHIKLKDREKYDRSLTVILGDSEEEVVLSKQAARQIWVRLRK